MTTTSASPAESRPVPAAPRAEEGILVWDWPVRVFHWTLVLCFAGAWLTSESERWQRVHVTLGYTVMGLVGFRLVWGLIGTRHARFTSFVRGPRAAARYLGSLLRGRPEHHVGHNPAGALAIVGLLGLALVVTGLGWATFHDLGGDLAEEGHEAAASLMLALVGVHVAGVLVGSLAHRESLVRAMFTGRRQGPRSEAIPRAWAPLGALLLAAVLGFWAWQAQAASTTPSDALAPAVGAWTVPPIDPDDDEDED